jgi:hypothetical protein
LFGRVEVDIVRHSTVPDNVHRLHVQITFHVWKTRGYQCSFRLLMMGGVSPETCWASYKYWIIQFWYTVAPCCISSLWTVLWCTDPRTLSLLSKYYEFVFYSTPAYVDFYRQKVKTNAKKIALRALQKQNNRLQLPTCFYSRGLIAIYC